MDVQVRGGSCLVLQIIMKVGDDGVCPLSTRVGLINQVVHLLTVPFTVDAKKATFSGSFEENWPWLLTVKGKVNLLCKIKRNVTEAAKGWKSLSFQARVSVKLTLLFHSVKVMLMLKRYLLLCHFVISCLMESLASLLAVPA